MSEDHEKSQNVTLLFVTQMRLRPEQVTASVNALLESDGLHLILVHTRATYQNPAQASIFDHLYPDDEGGPAFPLNTAEKGVLVRL